MDESKTKVGSSPPQNKEGGRGASGNIQFFLLNHHSAVFPTLRLLSFLGDVSITCSGWRPKITSCSWCLVASLFVDKRILNPTSTRSEACPPFAGLAIIGSYEQSFSYISYLTTLYIVFLVTDRKPGKVHRLEAYLPLHSAGASGTPFAKSLSYVGQRIRVV